MRKYVLFGILALAIILRLWNLSAGDITGNDEVLYGFRAVGILDYDNAPNQTTPLEWFDPSTSSGNIPFWTKLSFHDHPPLVFFVQNIFMKIFGESVFGFRLPSAIFGILSVYLVYLVGTKLFSKNTGLIASLLTAVTVNHVYVSRIGIQESYVIFFLLLTSYLFLKSLDEEKYLPWTGVAFGFALLTKYTTGILAPIFLTYLLIHKREYFFNKKLWLGALLSLLIFSPVILYNIQLYRAVGHFDFQISYILGQDPEVWQKAPGKEEIGGLGDRIRNFLPKLFNSNSWIFVSLFLLTIPFSIFLFRKNPKIFKEKLFLDVALFWLIVLMIFIGPTLRFLTMLTPFLALKIAFFTNLALSHMKAGKLAKVALVLFIVFEIIYSINSQILNYPIGPLFWTWSKVRYDNYAWGYNELDKFLTKELEGKMPLLSFDLQYKFLQEVQSKGLEKAKSKKLQPYPAIIVYDGNIHSAPQLWSLDRLQIYHGWPVIKTEDYLKINNWQGIKATYFITPTERLPLKPESQLTDAGAMLEEKLLENGVSPIILANKRSEPVFRIYKF